MGGVSKKLTFKGRPDKLYEYFVFEAFDGVVLKISTYSGREDKLEKEVFEGYCGKRDDGSYGFDGAVVKTCTYNGRWDNLKEEFFEGDWGIRADGSEGFVGVVVKTCTYSGRKDGLETEVYDGDWGKRPWGTEGFMLGNHFKTDTYRLSDGKVKIVKWKAVIGKLRDGGTLYNRYKQLTTNNNPCRIS